MDTYVIRDLVKTFFKRIFVCDDKNWCQKEKDNKIHQMRAYHTPSPEIVLIL